jgi:hypothetical protein
MYWIATILGGAFAPLFMSVHGLVRLGEQRLGDPMPLPILHIVLWQGNNCVNQFRITGPVAGAPLPFQAPEE